MTLQGESLPESFHLETFVELDDGDYAVWYADEIGQPSCMPEFVGSSEECTAWIDSQILPELFAQVPWFWADELNLWPASWA